jgi:hypothetical protein
MSADQVFKRVSRPPAIPGLEEWGIPPPTGEKPSPALQVRSPDYVMSEELMYVGKMKAKVGNFLRLKVEEDRHINTTLLSSTAFANPHIYSKLVSPIFLSPVMKELAIADPRVQVEFVDIDERGSAFPGGGWITRRNLETRIPTWGAKALGTPLLFLSAPRTRTLT